MSFLRCPRGSLPHRLPASAHMSPGGGHLSWPSCSELQTSSPAHTLTPWPCIPYRCSSAAEAPRYSFLICSTQQTLSSCSLPSPAPGLEPCPAGRCLGGSWMRHAAFQGAAVAQETTELSCGLWKLLLEGWFPRLPGAEADGRGRSAEDSRGP